MHINKLVIGIVLFFFSFISYSQEHIPKNNGIKTPLKKITALINATIHIDPSRKIENGQLLIENNKIIAVGEHIKIPVNADIIDLKGKFIYPSFIDIYSSFGINLPESAPRSRNPQYDANRTGYYWNDHIRPETEAIEYFNYNKKTAETYLKSGFGIVNTHRHDAIASGTGLLVALDQNGDLGTQVIDEKSAQYFSFGNSRLSRQSYPRSIMGKMAIIRQLQRDADWYAKGNISNKDLSIEAFNQNKNEIQIFRAGSWLNDLRVDKIGDEFNIQYVIVGGGNEYKRIQKIKETNATYILPINFPKAYDVANPHQAAKLTLNDMKHWNWASSNPKIMAENNIPFALTTYQLKSIGDFKSKLLKAIEYGLNKQDALAALTIIPAKILGKSEQIGTIAIGSYANFTITSNDIFEKSTTIFEHWIMGKRNIFESINYTDIRGKYDLSINNNQYNLTITGQNSKPTAEILDDTIKLSSQLIFSDDWLNLIFMKNDSAGYTKLVGKILSDSSSFEGKVVFEDGNESTFKATYLTENLKDSITLSTIEQFDNLENKKAPTHSSPIIPLSFPNSAYGNINQPKAEILLFKNTTVWTNEKDGILKNYDVLIKNGKINKIGQNLIDKDALIIDGTDKHLTCGIVDEHAHIATSAVNEGGQNCSAEVTIEDVINPEDLGIYRNLAGGVTTMQILHGSANPIGGRSALVKLKWGVNPDEMLIPNADKFIKFALGENVKQSNWESYVRFPQTRMGVEQLYIDYFTRAKEYDNKKKKGFPYRIDDELETLAEILNKERFITCHSYVQSEINMLMKVAEKFDFKINTFTHILEGYKVADKMKTHGVGGSTFSDWWAYKYEVKDAIPHNGAIMHKSGITVAFNSDDAEMSRRLNQEAAKAIKYGNVSEEEAWKFVTLNPAKLLHLDDKIGSIKVGKDADIVLWDNNPLSVYAKAEMTFIEGIRYFDIQRDLELRKRIKTERNLLINLMLKVKNNGGKTQSVKKKDKTHIHCDHEGDVQF